VIVPAPDAMSRLSASAALTKKVPVVVAPFLNPPTNVQTSVTENNVKVTWNTPEDSGTAVERYAVTWTYDGQPGWGIGVVGNEFTITGLPENKEVTVWVRADNDTLRVYSQSSLSATATTGTIVVPPIDPPVDPVEPEPPVDPVEPEPPVTPEEPVVPPIVPTEPIEIPSEPVVEEPKEEPSPLQSLNSLVNIAPSEMTEAQVEQLQEAAYAVLESTEQGSPEYEEALDALFVAAQADDIEVSEELAAIPVLGNVAVGITNAINFIGNVGADMSPAVREKSEKIVVSAVVVGQIAATAGMTAASVSAGGIRRNT
jgi:hypothetical protein